jgi:hypothetical protein
MLSPPPTQPKSRSLKRYIEGCLFAAIFFGIAACNFASSLQTPAIPNDAESLQTPGIKLTPYLINSPRPTSQPSASPTAIFTLRAEAPVITEQNPTPPQHGMTPTPEDSHQAIGRSVEGRPLEIYRFGNGPDQRLIIAGIHGGYEWNSSKLANELITYLQANPQRIPADKTLYILPNLNPDGEARMHGPDGRANAKGVDLNRNFPANWEKNYRRSGCWQERPTTAGLAPASEPETQAVIAFVKDHPSIQAAISYHSAALGIFPGGLPPDANAIDLAESLAEVSGYRYPPMDTGCIYTGEMVNWLATRGIPAVDVELTNHRDTDFEINLKVLGAFLSWQPPSP